MSSDFIYYFVLKLYYDYNKYVEVLLIMSLLIGLKTNRPSILKTAMKNVLSM